MLWFMKKSVYWAFSLVSNSKGSIKCAPNNHPRKARPSLVNVNTDESLFYQFIVSVNKWNGSCNIADDSYVRVCVPDNIKNINVKGRNVM